MRTLVAALLVVALAGPAVAQIGINLLDDNKRIKTQDEVDRSQAIEDAYKSTMKKVPDQKKVTNDPWADARGVSQPTTVQKQGRTNAANKSN
jgi:hypothetical protein